MRPLDQDEALPPSVAILAGTLALSWLALRKDKPATRYSARTPLAQSVRKDAALFFLRIFTLAHHV
jgi:hypothetical protein